jgi:hypothetical protein
LSGPSHGARGAGGACVEFTTSLQELAVNNPLDNFGYAFYTLATLVLTLLSIAW